MNKQITPFLIGFLVVFAGGFFVCWFFFVRKIEVTNVITNVEYIYIEKNAEEITEKPIATVKMNRREVDVFHSLFTPYYGLLKMSTTLDRKALQYKHRLNVDAIYLLNTKTALLGINYSYKRWHFGVYGGYSFEINDYEIGTRLGVTILEW